MIRKGFSVVLASLLFGLLPAFAQDDIPPAPIVNDEGGAVSITGDVIYTNPLFTDGVGQPLVILEDQAGFVDRNEYFLMPVESQTLGQITSDFYNSPFSYSLTLPIEPRGSLRDVDDDGEKDTGVQIFAVAYWANTFGDPYLEVRDLYGGGWSTAYASTLVSSDADTPREIIGGKYLVYAPDDQQGFPSGFGPDELLFTGDEPIVRLPEGYTVVDMDTDPFTFDRSAHPVIDLLEPDVAAVDDFSGMSFTDAFDAMLDKMRREYAFTEYKGIDWDTLGAKYRPLFEEAEADNSELEYERALHDFLWSIPDGHVAGPIIPEDIQAEFGGGLGLALRQLDDGRVIVVYVGENTPASAAGIEVGAEIQMVNDQSVDDYLDTIIPPLAPISSPHNRRQEQLTWSMRFPLNQTISVQYQNPDSSKPSTVDLTTTIEWDSLGAGTQTPFLTGLETPVEYELLDNGYAYVKIYSFNDNSLLTVQLWERLMSELNTNAVPGLIIDMRQNGGGSGFLADQMAAYFFNEPLELGNTAYYDEKRDEFVTDERGIDRFYLPAPELRYQGPIAVLISPDCYSACEFFTYDMTLQDRAAIVGEYPTGGLGGSIQDFYMPGGQRIRFTVGRALDADGNIHIEGKGVAPTIDVPVTEETVLSSGDPVLDAAVDYLNAR
ncbi:MAG: hypothetical protein K8L99_29050 [Anaerolineae bacterium]|nr:hypothetical protein [Anaerolineae bacterium]